MKQIIFVLLLGITFPLLSQEIVKEKTRDNSIFIAPFNMFDIINPSVQIGYERMIKNRYAVQIEVAYIMNHSIENYLIDALQKIKDCPITNSGFRVRTEFKYFIIKKKRIGFYCSGELFYMQNKSNIGIDFYRDFTFTYPTSPPENANAYTDLYCNDKKQIGFNAKVGLKIWLGKHFFIEPHGGIGLIYRKNRHFERDNPQDKFVNTLDKFWYRAGNSFIPSIPFNVKFGIRF